MGTDCSIEHLGYLRYKLSRPYGDGLFLAIQVFLNVVRVPSLRGTDYSRMGAVKDSSTPYSRDFNRELGEWAF